jgi:hypothetical protein
LAKINNPSAQPPRASWPWPKDVREQIILKTDLQPPKQRKEGDPKNPPLPSDRLLQHMRTDGGVTATRLSAPPTLMQFLGETAMRAERRQRMRKAFTRATKSKSSMAKLLGGADTSRLPPERQDELSREAALFDLLEGLGADIDEIARKRAEIGEEI